MDWKSGSGQAAPAHAEPRHDSRLGGTESVCGNDRAMGNLVAAPPIDVRCPSVKTAFAMADVAANARCLHGLHVAQGHDTTRHDRLEGAARAMSTTI